MLVSGETSVEITDLVVEGRTFNTSAKVEYIWDVDNGSYSDSPPDDPELEYFEVQGLEVDEIDAEGNVIEQNELPEELLEKICKAVQKKIKPDDLPINL